MKKNYIKKAAISDIKNIFNSLSMTESQEILHAKKWHNLLIVEVFKCTGEIEQRYFFNGTKDFIAQIFLPNNRYKWLTSTDLLLGSCGVLRIWTKEGHKTAKEYFGYKNEENFYLRFLIAPILEARREAKKKKTKKVSKDAYAFPVLPTAKKIFDKAVISAHADISEGANRFFAKKIGKNKYKLKCSICGHEHTVDGSWKEVNKATSCPKCGHKSVVSNRYHRPVCMESLFYWAEYRNNMIALTGYQVTSVVDFDWQKSFVLDWGKIPKERIIIKKDNDGRIKDVCYKWSKTNEMWEKTNDIWSWEKPIGIGYCKPLSISWSSKNLIRTLKKAMDFYGSKYVSNMVGELEKTNIREDISPLLFFDRFALELSNLGASSLRKRMGYPNNKSFRKSKIIPFCVSSYKSCWNNEFEDYFDSVFSDNRLKGMISNGMNLTFFEAVEVYAYFKEKGLCLSQKELMVIDSLMVLIKEEQDKEKRPYLWSPTRTMEIFVDLVNKKRRPVKVYNYLMKQKRLLNMPIHEVLDLIKDYRRMSNQLGISLNDSLLAFPKNIKVAHDLRTQQVNKEKAIKEAASMKDVARRLIAVYPENLKREYRDEKAGLLIRPFLTLSELKREGNLQHHCVYSYKKHPENLFVVRQLSDPNTPYVTVEANNNKIYQAKGRFNSAPTEEVQQFLSALIAKGYFANAMQTNQAL